MPTFFRCAKTWRRPPAQGVAPRPKSGMYVALRLIFSGQQHPAKLDSGAMCTSATRPTSPPSTRYSVAWLEPTILTTAPNGHRLLSTFWLRLKAAVETGKVMHAWGSLHIEDEGLLCCAGMACAIPAWRSRRHCSAWLRLWKIGWQASGPIPWGCALMPGPPLAGLLRAGR